MAGSNPCVKRWVHLKKHFFHNRAKLERRIYLWRVILENTNNTDWTTQNWFRSSLCVFHLFLSIRIWMSLKILTKKNEPVYSLVGNSDIYRTPCKSTITESMSIVPACPLCRGVLTRNSKKKNCVKIRKNASRYKSSSYVLHCVYYKQKKKNKNKIKQEQNFCILLAIGLCLSNTRALVDSGGRRPPALSCTGYGRDCM